MYNTGFGLVSFSRGINSSMGPEDIGSQRNRRECLCPNWINETLLTVSNGDLINPNLPRRFHTGSQFDLANAEIVIEDGTYHNGTVATVTAIGDVTIAVTLTAGTIIPVGLPLYHPANTEYVTVTAVTTTLGVTTKVGVSPAVAAIWAKDSSVTFGPHQLYVKVGKGNVSYTEHRGIEYTLNRRKLDEVRLADEQPVDVAFGFNWEFITGDSSDPPTIEDALKQRGAASIWLTTDPDTCRPYSVNVSIRYNPPCADGTKSEWITLPYYRYDQLSHDATAGAVTTQGKCNALEAIVSRVKTFPLDTAF